MMFEQKVRATFGMYERIPANFLGEEATFQVHIGQQSLTGQISYQDIKSLSVEDRPIGADTVFWVLACVLCLIPVIGWLAFPLVYILRKETVLGVTCQKTYFSLHGPGARLERIWRFLESQTGRTLHVAAVRAGKPSFSDTPKAALQANEEVPSGTETISQATHCASCGTPIKPGDKFCENCGATL
ncbi:MAG: zinc ribbon domain-containing protein [Candidatus Hodarchaeales archaeon]